MKILRLVAPVAIVVAALSMSYAESTASAPSPILYVANLGGGGITEYRVPNGEPASLLKAIGGSNSVTSPIGVAFGALRNVYAVDHGSQSKASKVLVFAPGAKGNAHPSAIIRCGGLNGAFGATTDRFGNIYVANSFSGSISIFPPGATGCVRGNRIIGGPHTGLASPLGVAIDNEGRIYATSMATSVNVYAAGATGDVGPVSRIAGPHTMLSEPDSVALDAEGDVYVTNLDSGALTEYAAGSSGDVAPIRIIGGQKTHLVTPVGVAVAQDGRIFISEFDSNAIYVFGPRAQGNVAPSQTIAGGANRPYGLQIANR